MGDQDAPLDEASPPATSFGWCAPNPFGGSEDGRRIASFYQPNHLPFPIREGSPSDADVACNCRGDIHGPTSFGCPASSRVAFLTERLKRNRAAHVER